jgi:hypothetical protein
VTAQEACRHRPKPGPPRQNEGTGADPNHHAGRSNASPPGCLGRAAARGRARLRRRGLARAAPHRRRRGGRTGDRAGRRARRPRRAAARPRRRRGGAGRRRTAPGRPARAGLALATADRLLAEALRRDGLQFAAVTDAAGRIAWASHAALVGASLADRESFGLHRAGRAEPLLAPALLDLPGGPRSLLLTRPLADARGGFAGVALVALDPRRIERALADAAILPGLRLALLRGDGTPIGAGSAGTSLPWPLPRADAPRIAGSDPPLAVAGLDLPGTDARLYAALDDAPAGTRRAMPGCSASVWPRRSAWRPGCCCSAAVPRLRRPPAPAWTRRSRRSAIAAWSSPAAGCA